MLHLRLCERDGLALGQQTAAAPQQRDRDMPGSILRQQLLFGDPAALHQLRKTRRWQALACPRQCGLQLVRQRQIHVVAAQHQVLAYGGARQHRQVALRGCSLHADQCQIGGAAAHIHHQYQTAVGQLGSQLLALQQQPVVKGCLGFFQQMHLLQTGQTGGLQRQCARALIE